MTEALQTLVGILGREQCSLVMQDAEGHITRYYKPGVRDLDELLRHHPERLRGALLADKVVGRAAAAFMAVGGVRSVHARVMSRSAAALLQQAAIAYSYTELVEQIEQPADSARCPLEQIAAPCRSPQEIVDTLRRHWQLTKQNYRR